MKQRQKVINRIIVIYIAGILISWTAEFWRDLFKSPIAAWTALDAVPSGRDFIWPVSGVKRIFSTTSPEERDHFAQAAKRYEAALFVADKERVPTGLTLVERDSAAEHFEAAAKHARKVDVNLLRNLHAELPTRYRYQFTEALDHFALALRQNDAVLWKVAESEMTAYTTWRDGAMAKEKP